jgi:hypothetical protein
MSIPRQMAKGQPGWAPINPPRSVEWYTPPEIFEALGLHFDLDPCSPVDGPVPWVPATRAFSASDDGLRQPWLGRVWLNPPYGRYIGRWTDKLLAHGDGIAFVFARTDTPWFQKALITANAVCWLRGRVRFVAPNGERQDNCGSPSVLLAYGDDCRQAVLRCGLGTCLDLHLTPRVAPADLALAVGVAE